MEKAGFEEDGDKDSSVDSSIEEPAPTFLTHSEETPQEAEELPIAAQPPQSILPDEDKVEVSASPAFKYLDDLYYVGKISGTKMAFFKQKYLELHELLIKTNSNVSQLHDESSSQAIGLQVLIQQLEEANKYPKNITVSTENTKLREMLLKSGNRLAEAKERLFQNEFKIECLTDEKNILEREYNRLPKPGEVDEKMKEIQKSIDDMRKEIYQKRLDLKQFQEEKSESQRLFQQDNKQYEQLCEKIETLKTDCFGISSQPNQIAKETDKLSRKNVDVEKQRDQIKAEYRECFESLMLLENRNMRLDKEKRQLAELVEKAYQSQLENESKIDSVRTVYEQTKEKTAQMMTERDELDISMHHVMDEKKRKQEQLTAISRNIERDQRQLKKTELQLKVANDNLNQLKNVLTKISLQKDSIPRDDVEVIHKKTDLKTENDLKTRALNTQNSLTAMEHVKLERSAEAEQMLLHEQIETRLELQELKRFSAIKTVEREKKAREKIRAENRYRNIREELKSKYNSIEDHKKKYQEKKNRLKIFAKKYEVIKNDRNKYVNLIQTSTQKASEMREKIKILQNEIEILRTAVLQKDKQLHKERLKHMHSVVVRDGLRTDMDKQQRVQVELEERCDQQKMETMKCNYMINQAEEQMIKLRKRYENAIQERNKKGESLIKLNSEVCLFYEKHNVQNDMIKKGNLELEDLEEDLKILNLEKNMLHREMNLLQKELPDKRQLKEELTTAQSELDQSESKRQELEKSIINRENDKSVRFLDGEDPSPADLQDKIEKLEMRMAEIEKQLMEKELIYDQVTRLTERVKRKADSGKEDTLDLAKKINEIQRKIKETTRKMMSLTAEVSMYQAKTIISQQELKQQEDLLEQCYVRMERGVAPTLEMEQEWIKMVQEGQRRKEGTLEKQLLKEEEEQYLNAGGAITTAEQRPNAYIPDDENELPIPRPYGKHTPFKPTESGSNMRHIRKPNPKPIEI